MWKTAFPVLALLIGSAACGEPIESEPAHSDTAERTLPVVASARTYKVGEAFRASIVMTRPGQGLTSRSQHVDVVTEVAAGRLAGWDRHLPDGSVRAMKTDATARSDFSMFEQLLPRRSGDVPEAWSVEGVFGALNRSTVLNGMPVDGGRAECRLKSVQVANGRARAVIAVEFRVETATGPIVLTGHIEHDLKEKLLVLVALEGTVAGDAVSILADRSVTKFVPPTRD